MNLAIFGSFGERVPASGWVEQSAMAFLGGGDLDLSGVEPGPGAELTAVAVGGSIDVVVDEGTRITMDGFSLFGSREVEVVRAGGPTVHIRAFAIFGSIDVRTPSRGGEPAAD